MRLVELDALRGIAATSVMLFHYTVILPRFYPAASKPLIAFYLGHYGVELFFIISGFVIFMTLEKCKMGSDFIVSRFSRIYPVFWVAVLLTYAAGSLYPLEGQKYNLLQLLVNMTMFQEYIKASNIDGVYWSLSYELGFYFAMYMLFRYNALKHIEVISVLWLILGLSYIHFPHLIPHPGQYLFVINAYTHLFVAGIALYKIWKYGWSTLRVAFLLFAPVAQFQQESWTGLVVISTFLIVFIFAINQKAPFLRWRPLVYLGNIAYSLYLIHHMLGFRLIQFLQEHGASSSVSIVSTIIWAIILASGLTHFIEKPAVSLIKRRWKNSSVHTTKTVT